MATRTARKPSKVNGAELVTIRHTPTGDDARPYTVRVTRKAWAAGCFPRSAGFELLERGAPAT